MIPILMHQMRISTNQVSSVVLSPKMLEIYTKLKKSKNWILLDSQNTKYKLMKSFSTCSYLYEVESMSITEWGQTENFHY
jgi:hypothetical protein